MLTPLAKSVLLPLGLTAGASVTNVGIHKDSWDLQHLIITMEEMKNNMKLIKFLEEFGLLIKSASKTMKNESKEQMVDFLVYF